MDTDTAIFRNALGEGSGKVRASRKLDELPGEILCMIARHMTNPQLRQFRELYNRRITHHIDHVFVNTTYFFPI